MSPHAYGVGIHVFGLEQRGVKGTVAAGGSGNFCPSTGTGYVAYKKPDYTHALSRSDTDYLADAALRELVRSDGCYNSPSRPGLYTWLQRKTAPKKEIVKVSSGTLPRKTLIISSGIMSPHAPARCPVAKSPAHTRATAALAPPHTRRACIDTR